MRPEIAAQAAKRGESTSSRIRVLVRIRNLKHRFAAGLTLRAGDLIALPRNETPLSLVSRLEIPCPWHYATESD